MSDLPDREALQNVTTRPILVGDWAKDVNAVLLAYASGRLVDREAGEKVKWCVAHDAMSYAEWAGCDVVEARLFVENP